MKRYALVVFLSAAAATMPTYAQQSSTSALAGYPGFGHNPAADEARYRQEQAARERLISRCMQRQGHTYVPEAPIEHTAAEVARRGRAAAAPVDRNERHARALPQEQRTAYYMALYGVTDPNDQSGQLWRPGSPTGGGCWGDALRAIPGVFFARSQFAGEFADMRRSI